MDSKFVPPKTKEEFLKRAENITPQAANAIIHALRTRRESLVKPIDEEIKFHKRVIDYKEKGELSTEFGGGTTA